MSATLGLETRRGFVKLDARVDLRGGDVGRCRVLLADDGAGATVIQYRRCVACPSYCASSP